MLNLNSILIFSENPKALADFYEKVLQKKPDWVDQEYYGFVAGATFLNIGPHDKIKGASQQPERIMINFETKETQAEFDRIKKLGVKVIAEPYSMADEEGKIATFADPDGNFFQLMPPWKD